MPGFATRNAPVTTAARRSHPMTWRSSDSMAPIRRIASGISLLAAAAAIATVGSAPLLVSGADHLDAPTTKANHRIDITDLYAFKSAGGTTLLLNVNPLTSPADTKTARFDTNAL